MAFLDAFRSDAEKILARLNDQRSTIATKYSTVLEERRRLDSALASFQLCLLGALDCDHGWSRAHQAGRFRQIRDGLVRQGAAQLSGELCQASPEQWQQKLAHSKAELGQLIHSLRWSAHVVDSGEYRNDLQIFRESSEWAIAAIDPASCRALVASIQARISAELLVLRVRRANPNPRGAPPPADQESTTPAPYKSMVELMDALAREGKGGPASKYVDKMAALSEAAAATASTAHKVPNGQWPNAGPSDPRLTAFVADVEAFGANVIAQDLKMRKYLELLITGWSASDLSPFVGAAMFIHHGADPAAAIAAASKVVCELLQAEYPRLGAHTLLHVRSRIETTRDWRRVLEEMHAKCARFTSGRV